MGLERHPLVDLFRGKVQDVAAPGRAGAVDEDVDAAEGAGGFPDHFAAVLQRGQVTGDRASLAARRFDFPDHLVQQVQVPGRDAHAGALPGQGQCAATPDAPAGAGDDRSFPAEFQVHGLNAPA